MVPNKVEVLEAENAAAEWHLQGCFFRSVNAGQVDRSGLGVSGLAVQIFNFLVEEPMSVCLGEILQ